MMNRIKAENALKLFLLEDIGDGDASSVIFENNEQGEAIVRAKADGVIAGLHIFEWGYGLLDPSLTVQKFKDDGDPISAGEPLVKVSGSVAQILAGERVFLNLVQRMSAIATLTNRCVEALGSSHTRIVDTRKTTPGLRLFEKYAVRVGGGFNHRNGLYDAVMLKDNHIAAAGSITEAVRKVRSAHGHMMMVEVEVETEDQLLEAIHAAPDVIMFDNQSPEGMKRWAEMVPAGIKTEASGGIDLMSLSEYRNTGVDVISIGALTHSVSNLDMSMNLSVSHKEAITK